MSDLKFWVWLTLCQGIAARKITYLLNRFDTAEEIYKAQKKDFFGIDGINSSDIESLCNKNMTKTEKVLSDCRKHGFKILTLENPLYPENLCNIFDPPYVLYVKSKERIDLNKHLCFSVVGNRKMTKYGQKVTRDIVRDLSRAGVTIVSGMARGVDAEAHRAALSVGGVTVAVLGSGLDICYPPEHDELMEAIAKTGLVISEYPPGTAPHAANFPCRNRIISGLSIGTLVTEGASGSGSLITARIALEQNREIFAVPGDITNRQSDACNGLICSTGATPIVCAEDILGSLRDVYSNVLEANRPKNEPILTFNSECDGKEIINKEEEPRGLANEIFARLSEKERLIVKNMSIEPIHIDKIAEAAGIESSEINSIFTMLEISGIIKSYPGKKFGLNI